MTRPTITAVAVLAFGLILSACTSSTTSSNPSGDTGASSQMETTTQPAESMLIDDTTQLAEGLQRISTTGTYQSPAQAEHVDFNLVVDEEGTIVDAASTVTSTNPTSQMRQTAFSEAFPQAVIGKKLSDLENLDRVGGSSLTTGAFNKALPELKSQL